LRFGFGQIGSVDVNVKDHVTGVDSDGCVRVSGGVVEELMGGASGLFGGVGLGGGDGAEGSAHGGVDGTGVIQEDAHDLLDAIRSVLGERGKVVDGGREFRGGAVLGCTVVGRMSAGKSPPA
jgi:hypothetical protein